MAIDSSIPLQVRGVQLDNPMDSMARAMQLRHLAGQQRMQEEQFTQTQRAQEQERTLSDLYRNNLRSDGTTNRSGMLRGLAERGMGSRIPGMQEGFAKLDKESAEGKYKGAQTDDLDLKTKKVKLDVVNGAFSSLLSRPNVTHDDAINAITGLVQQGFVKPEEGAQMARMLPGDPVRLREFLVEKGMESMDAAKRIEMLTPKREMKDTGKQLVPVDMNPMTNPNPVPLAKTTTPGEDLSAATARRGQNMVDSRARQGQDDGKWQYDSSRGGLVNLKTGEFKSAMENGEPIGGAKTGNRVQDAKDAISLIDEANKLLDNATGSYGGVARDAVAQVFGKATEGSKAAARLKALEGMLVSKMPKMSGPQSDKDVAMYKQMAAVVGDATQPTETRKAALDTVREIQERYAGMPSRPTGNMRSQSGVVTPEAAPAAGQQQNIVVDW